VRVPAWVWFVWIGLFVVLETVAILTAERGDTLTETTLTTLPGLLGSAVILGFFGWLAVHFGRRVFARWRG
jgi:hypothetical protein